MPDDDFKQFRVFLEERQRGIEASFQEFKAQLKAETGRVERAAADMQRTVNELDKSLTGIAAANWPAKIEKLEQKVEKSEERVRQLENWRYWIMGGLAVLGLLLGYVMKRLP